MSEIYQLAAILKRGSRKQKVLRVIAESEVPLSSSVISRRSGIAQPNTISALKELVAKGAVDEVTGGKRDRMWMITNKGKEALLMKEKLPSIT